jgi:Protein of unknown function (DUF3987)
MPTSYPRTYTGDLASPPTALAPLCLKPNWVTWRWQRSSKGDSWTKPPYRVDNPAIHAANNDPSSWGSHSEAVRAVTVGKAHGVGFCLMDTNVAAIDIDKCRDPETGAIDKWAQRLLDAAPDTYVETTVSGTGLRIIGIASGPETHRRFNITGRKGAGVEVYRRAVRFITVSGLQHNRCNELTNIDALIDEIVAEHDITDNTEKIKTTDDGGNGFDNIDSLIRNGAPETQRSEAFARCVWSLAGQGLSADEIEEELRHYPNGIMHKYADRLRREVDRCYAKWQRQNQSAGTSTATASATSPHSWDDPDISILDDRRGNLPNFPTDIFALPIREWLERAAHGAGVFPDHVAVPMLGVVASLIGTARRVRASRSWSEPITLWTALVAASGDRKTPGLNVTRKALDLIETDQVAAIAAARLVHETRAQSAREAAKKWKEDRQQALEDKPPREPPPMPMEALDPGNFIEPRLYATDPTIEKLAALLQVRPRGMLLLRDELAGLFANMGRYSGGSDRPFWLEAWVGGRHVVERVSGTIVINHLLVGVVGSFQPDKLARAFQGDEDGMYGRFLYGWALTPDYRPLTNEVAEIEPELQSALKALIRLPAEDADNVFAPQVIQLSQEAVERFEDYRRHVDKMRRALDGVERQWLVKSESQVLRLAGALTYLTWAFALGTSGTNGLAMITADLEPHEIGEEFMTAAIRLVKEYFWPHARAALRQIGLTDRHRNARRALRWIAAHGKYEVSREDIRRDALGQSLDAEQTQDLIDALERWGWLREDSTRTPGRTRRRWLVNPKLFVLSTAGSAESAESPLHLIPHPLSALPALPATHLRIIFREEHPNETIQEATALEPPPRALVRRLSR